MSENNESALELSARHKQERKELQAKIQALKKSVTKGDKKKKKEVQEEIAQLESSLEEKQEAECATLSQSTVETGMVETHRESNDTATPNIKQDRVSKAQKRRDKKAAANKEREENIKDQDKINLDGPRHKETVAITKILKERGLQLFNIPADGNCLYKAVEHQLELFDGVNPEFKLTKLRKLTAEHLRENADNFLPFLTNPDTGDMLTPGEFKEYCRKVERTTAWGGQVELQALSNILKRRIEVIQATGPSTILGEEFPVEKNPLILTYHRHMYRLGEHYNSVQPVAVGDNSTNDVGSDEEQ